MDNPLISIGWGKGEMDFGVNCSVSDLSIVQMNQLRIMTFVAIGEAHRMWRDASGKRMLTDTGTDKMI